MAVGEIYRVLRQWSLFRYRQIIQFEKMSLFFRSMVRQTKKIKRKGGSYRTPMNPIDKFNLRIVTAHGTLSPEYYYIVPANVYLMLPNMCGVGTSTEHVVSQPLFQTPEEGIRTFLNRFIKGGTKTDSGAPFTVYEPGDIIPIHVVTFNPTLSTNKYFLTDERYPNYAFGYVGTFQPGALEKVPFLDYAVVSRGHPINNHFMLSWRDLKYSYAQEKYLPGDKWVVQRYCMALINYLNGLGGIYTEFLEPYAGYKMDTMTRADCDMIMRRLLPVIPENSMAAQIIRTNTYNYSMYDIISDLISKRTDDAPLYVLFNVCRTLQEDSVPETNWNANMTKKTKPSMELIRAISNSGHTNSSPAAVNMNTINTFRKAKGLSVHKHSVIKHDQLLALLRETKESYSASTDADFEPILAKIDPLVAMLSTYAPHREDRVGATIFMDNNIERINKEIEESIRATEEAEGAAAAASASEAAAASTAQREHELLVLKRRRNKLKENIAFLKSGKKNATEKKAELASVLAQIKGFETPGEN